jgi:hypothetical protein
MVLNDGARGARVSRDDVPSGAYATVTHRISSPASDTANASH